MIRHLAGIAEVVEDMTAAVAFYRDVLGLAVEYEEGSRYGLVLVPGVIHFGLWSRAAAAIATFGDEAQVDRIPLGFTVGFEVDEVQAGSNEIESNGWPMAQSPKTEPWGQKTSRFFSTSGALCEISDTPAARRLKD
jgi:catechol 2,3-dioxygenase-like lactoylglutathione lyase family enzyme